MSCAFAIHRHRRHLLRVRYVIDAIRFHAELDHFAGGYKVRGLNLQTSEPKRLKGRQNSTCIVGRRAHEQIEVRREPREPVKGELRTRL